MDSRDRRERHAPCIARSGSMVLGGLAPIRVTNGVGFLKNFFHHVVDDLWLAEGVKVNDGCAFFDQIAGLTQ